MTEVSDKHKPSPKHTLEEVRKSLEDLVRNQLDDKPPDASQATAAESDQAAPSSVDAPTESVPLRSRHRRHRSEAAGLETDQVLNSLRDLLGNELSGTRDDQYLDGEDISVDTAAGKIAQYRAEDHASPPDMATEHARATDATDDLVAITEEPKSAPPSTDADGLGSTMPTDIDDIDTDSIELELEGPAQPEASVTTTATADADEQRPTPAALDEASAEDWVTLDAPTDEVAHSQPTADEGPWPSEESFLQADDETEEITLEVSPDTALESEGISGTDSEGPEALKPESSLDSSFTGDALEPSPVPEDLPPSSEDNAPLTPGPVETAISAEVDSDEASQAAAPEVIAVSSPAGVQHAFVFEDPTLTAARHFPESQVPTERDEQAEGGDTPPAESTAAARHDPNGTRQLEDSELVLEQEDVDANTAFLATSAPDEHISIGLPEPALADADDAGQKGVFDDASSDRAAVGEELAADDDDSQHLEDVAELTTMDALEIPGGEQLSEAMAQPKPPSPADDTSPDVTPAMAAAEGPEEVAKSLELEADVLPTEALELEEPPIKNLELEEPPIEDLELEEPPTETRAPEMLPSEALEPKVPTTGTLELDAPPDGDENETAQAPDARADAGDKAPAAKPRPRRSKRVLTAAVDSQSDTLTMPSIDFSADRSLGDAGDEQPKRAINPEAHQHKPELPVSDSEPMLSADADQQTPDAEFVELGSPIVTPQQTPKTRGVSLEDVIRARGESTKSGPAAPFGQGRETRTAGMPHGAKPTRADKPGAALPLDQSPAEPSSTMAFDTAAGFGSGTRTQTDPREPARKDSLGNIPVLRDVVPQPQVDAPHAQEQKKPASPKADGEQRRVLEKKPVRLKSKKLRKSARGGARNVAVQVVAKLNMELRKCGERALSPAIIDRLQFLLREVLEQQTAKKDNTREKK